MTWWRILTVLALVSGASVPSFDARAEDSTIPCSKPPSDGAFVAVHSGTAVTVTQDMTDNTCTFAVDGAVAKSPPSDVVLAALRAFQAGGNGVPNEADSLAQALAALLASAAPVDEVPGELKDPLKQDFDALRSCLLSFFDGGIPDADLKNSQGACKGIRAYKNERDKKDLIAQKSPAVFEDTLMIVVHWKSDGGHDLVSSLFLPRFQSR
jgi:hypothetical protein